MRLVRNNFVFVSLFLVVLVVGYLLLVPYVFGADKGFVPCGRDRPCTTCDVFVLSQNILNFIWNPIAVSVAALMIAYGGFLLMVPSLGGEKSPGTIQKGKKVLTRAIVGIALVFLAWLAVDTIIKALAGQDIGSGTPAKIQGFGPWNKIECTAPGFPTTGASPEAVQELTTPSTGTLSGDKLFHEEAVSLLLGSAIPVTSSGNCSNKNNPTCTSLEGVKRSTILRVILFKTESKCPVVISGGTEIGHESGPFSHASGDKVDMSRNSCVDSFIEKNYQFTGRRTNDNALVYRAPDNAEFAKETDHWDIRGWDVLVK